MIIAVCVKQILDPGSLPLFNRSGDEKAVRSAGVEMVMSPFDEQAVEAAVQIKESQTGSDNEASVILFSIGTPDTKDVLKHGLSMGADEAVGFLDEMILGRFCNGVSFSSSDSVYVSPI